MSRRPRADDGRELVGRAALCDELIDAFNGSRPVELIGDPDMGRRELMDWLARRASATGRAVARVDAGALPKPTPAVLVHKLAETLGRLTDVSDALFRDQPLPEERDAIRALRRLGAAILVVDEADALLKAGHGFSAAFFDALVGMVHDGALQWVSSSRVPLGESLAATDARSTLRTGTTKLHVGALDRVEVMAALETKLGEAATEAMKVCGTLPSLVQRLFAGEDHERVVEDVARWAEPLFSRWWNEHGASGLLARLAQGAALERLSAVERAQAVELANRGLVLETKDGYLLNGSAWSDYVRRRAPNEEPPPPASVRPPRDGSKPRMTPSSTQIVDLLATLFPDESRAVVVLRRAGFPLHLKPAFPNPLVFWSNALAEVDNGALAGGCRPLLEEAAKQYPNNEDLARLLRAFGPPSGSPAPPPPAPAPSGSEAPRVYLARCEADAAHALRLATELRDRHGLNVWLEDWEILPGDLMQEKHQQAIQRATIFVVLISRTALRDPWMQQHQMASLQRAIERTQKVIPVTVDGLAVDEIPDFLAIRRAVDVGAVAVIAEAIRRST